MVGIRQRRDSNFFPLSLPTWSNYYCWWWWLCAGGFFPLLSSQRLLLTQFFSTILFKHTVWHSLINEFLLEHSQCVECMRLKIWHIFGHMKHLLVLEQRAVNFQGSKHHIRIFLWKMWRKPNKMKSVRVSVPCPILILIQSIVARSCEWQHNDFLHSKTVCLQLNFRYLNRHLFLCTTR